jgi:hypothetical protein
MLERPQQARTGMAHPRRDAALAAFKKTFRELAPYKNNYEVFRDFVTMAACSLHIRYPKLGIAHTFATANLWKVLVAPWPLSHHGLRRKTTATPFSFRSFEKNQESLRGLFFIPNSQTSEQSSLNTGEGHHHPRIVSRSLAVKNRAAALLWRTVPSLRLTATAKAGWYAGVDNQNIIGRFYFLIFCVCQIGYVMRWKSTLHLNRFSSS